MYFLYMFHLFSLVCFLIYGVKSRSGHDRSKIVPLPTYLFKPKCSLNNRVIRTTILKRNRFFEGPYVHMGPYEPYWARPIRTLMARAGLTK